MAVDSRPRTSNGEPLDRRIPRETAPSTGPYLVRVSGERFPPLPTRVAPHNGPLPGERPVKPFGQGPEKSKSLEP